MIKFANFSSSQFLLLLLAATCCCAAASQFLDEVSGLVDSKNAAAAALTIESTDVGYDLHKDMFYFSDDLVARAYKRNKYADTKVTLAGQSISMTGNKVAKAVHPFAVGQKSVGISGSSADRWDVKQDANGNQYLALYHAYGSHFVVNKLRAHLLRRVANDVRNYLPVLDQTHKLNDDKDNDAKEEYISKVREEIVSLIKDSFQNVDDEIREQLKNSDDSAASATVVILSQKFVIVANAGEGRVLAYDGTSTMSNLTPKLLGATPKSTNNLFGSKKSRPVGGCKPYVEVYERFRWDEEEDDEYEVQLVLLETPIVANLLPNEEAIQTVLNQVKIHKKDIGAEQDLYTSSVTKILQTVTKKGGFFNMLTNTDYSTMLVGLQTDYKQIF